MHKKLKVNMLVMEDIMTYTMVTQSQLKAKMEKMLLIQV